MRKSLRNSFILLVLVGAFHSSVNAQFDPSSPLPPDNIVENEYIIKFKENQTLQDVQTQVAVRSNRSQNPLGILQNFQQDLSLQIKGEDKPEEILTHYQSVDTNIGVTTRESLEPLTNTFVYKTNGTETLQEVLAAYEDLPIEYIEPVNLLYFYNTPNDTDYNYLWGMDKINAETAWDQTTGSQNVKVAVVDSGVDKTHPDLQNNVIYTKQVGADCPSQGDLVGHGTHVSGTIGAMGNNNRGVAGVNWTVSILGYCAGTDGLPETYIIRSIQDAVQNGAKVINMSFGGPGDDPSVKAIIQQNPNVLFVASAGNCGYLPPNQGDPNNPACTQGGDASHYFPARYGATMDNVITVAATGPNNEWAKYSSYGQPVTITAPGGNPPNGSRTCANDGSDCIHSTLPGGAYDAWAGTSMSAPHVTGLAALMLSKDSSLTPKQIKEKLSQTAVDLGPAGRDDKFGSGIINAPAALNAIGNNPPTGGPTSQPTNPPQGTATPTFSPAITTPQPTPSVGGTHPCPAEAEKGNYDCNSVTDDNDRLAWEREFKAGTVTLGPFFEWIRRALYNRN
ncbi:hypothetical protein A3H80_01460 [Candidatus Roizmanbacteria bacterium RIFCSPLOWO2_02_FULL_37_19]|uniref:Peptidase S8/S53 domain-containing protein n=1 Tax=Candidatus Roizmanbacteria bacterium RIFCSPHIGHO2_02_FULL_37_24 TaxID=1802037 RepID=A0A1F7GW03_9BACT|nr:MAG: hypothetical protein A2862_01480 [Candidatus Roizmanbacteria bacterium RIFCSPHIGHO2_01_FULL_38_41]OGK22995.1 MAG: hypothetical protein A3C24_02545 [Candidatus Roizmanbacteria bacterium RIFCSPHIGHO2_02_FULL_37_24]OGK32224.1 MAG: hypothetical protein A3E10_02180 [Candidatus Roizmanbacteria bacterium RIFCSPHIGHO2_12_FULL_37_23]OGK45652.1 MAG: hypothetical protein A2956_00680 [Candidatus Roizmanbacteria bacterium RIFCSPLOWO2_01_FULL_37_57]OGK53857.1 MAG: hypothetical protein A3H80_01460 [Ca